MDFWLSSDQQAFGNAEVISRVNPLIKPISLMNAVNNLHVWTDPELLPETRLIPVGLAERHGRCG